MSMKKRDSAMLGARWKVRVGSPRELIWELHQFLIDRGYKSDQPYIPLGIEEAPIEGTAISQRAIEAHRDSYQRSLWLVLLGIILCTTVVLLPFGILLIRLSKYTLSYVFLVQVEGEAYRASARSQDPTRVQSEVVDVASNARIRVTSQVRRARGSHDWSSGKILRRDAPEWAMLEQEFRQIGNELNKLIPKIALPVATEDMAR